MQVTIIGGGPGGLYAAILLAQRGVADHVTVLERNAPDDTFGFGVVFSAATLGELADADQPSYDALMASSARWDPVELRYAGQAVRVRGNRFAAIERRRLLAVLQQRAGELGVDLRFSTEVADPADHLGADLVVGSDGANSRVRERFADAFAPRVRIEGDTFIWLGTTRMFDAFTFVFRDTEHGPFRVHAYPYADGLSTFIVECDRTTWRRAGLDAHAREPLPPGESDLATRDACEQLFADVLDGHPLLVNNSKWLDWRTVQCRRWRHGNVVLLGDAAHTAHFSIGSGTKLAMEDAMALVAALERHPGDRDGALRAYEAERRPAVDRMQELAAASRAWFERSGRYLRFEPPQLAYGLLTRSQRVTYDNLRRRDPAFVAAYQRWFAARAGLGDGLTPPAAPPPPAFTPFATERLSLPNRLVATVGDADDAVHGEPSAVHAQRMARLAAGGAGLVRVEQLAVAADARVTPGSAGLYDDGHADAWRAALEQARWQGTATLVAQLSHAGRRGACEPRHRGVDRPLARGAWPLVAPSPLPYTPRSQTPAALDRAGLERIRDAFVAAARRADAAGFDAVEIDVGHGYLLASFLSPLANQRDDELGGALKNRLAFPLEVVRAVREAWPADRAVTARLTASDLQAGGLTDDEAVEAAGALADAGVELIEVVAGHTTPWFRPAGYDTAFHAPWADLVRNTAGVPTVCSGNIPTDAEATDVLAAGRADLCVIGRPLPPEPDWLAPAT